MATISKFYLHAATTGDTGTLPGASTLSVTKATPDVTAAGASTNRSMNGTIGTSQVSQALTTLASTLEKKNWYRRFCSDPIAAQTIAAQYVSLHLGLSQSNTNSDPRVWTAGSLWIWRPGTGAKVGTALADLTPGTGASTTTLAGTTEEAKSATLSGANTTVSQTSQDGDILVFEMWTDQTQLMATAYTNTVFYDGTTENSTTNNAAYLLFTDAVTMFTAAAGSLPYQHRPILQAVNRTTY